MFAEDKQAENLQMANRKFNFCPLFTNWITLLSTHSGPVGTGIKLILIPSLIW